MLKEKHPTVSERYMLQNSDVRATSSLGNLEIYPWTELPDLLKNLSMSENNCTKLIPLK